MYGLTITTPATADPVSLAEARAQCKVDVAEDDATLASLIIGARMHLELVTGRAFPVQEFTLTLDRFPCGTEAIVLPRAPLVSITSIAYIDEAGAAQTLAAPSYYFDSTRDPARVFPVPGGIWPGTQARAAAVSVRFFAGYQQIPEPLRLALLLLVCHWYENREAVLVGSAAAPLPMGVEALIAPYRLWSLS